MGKAHGSVGACQKVVDHGANARRWNLVVLGDGYTAAELGNYHKHVDAFVAELGRTAPFNVMWNAINVHRIDVTSDQSGADNPTACGGDGVSVQTYYDATFCSPWNGTRLAYLLTVDAQRAHHDAVRSVPETHQVLVIVNSDRYGGSGGRWAAVCSPVSMKIAIHELGHSAFDLADEYEGDQEVRFDPVERNVTTHRNPANIPWSHLIDNTTPIPTSCHPDCDRGCSSPAGFVASVGLVGLYEGARYIRCGLYRSSAVCYMRRYDPFCAACEDLIRSRLACFMPATTARTSSTRKRRASNRPPTS